MGKIIHHFVEEVDDNNNGCVPFLAIIIFLLMSLFGYFVLGHDTSKDKSDAIKKEQTTESVREENRSGHMQQSIGSYSRRQDVKEERIEPKVETEPVIEEVQTPTEPEIDRSNVGEVSLDNLLKASGQVQE